MTETPPSQLGISMDDVAGLSLDADASPSAVYEALSDERRRRTLAALASETPPVDARTLARRVAAEGARAAGASASLVDSVHVSLYHVHLPKLADCGLIEYDVESGTVEDVADGVGAIST